MTGSTEVQETKKIKLDQTSTKVSGAGLQQAPDEEWPEAWLMPVEVFDQKALNKLEPSITVTAVELRELGIL